MGVKEVRPMTLKMDSEREVAEDPSTRFSGLERLQNLNLLTTKMINGELEDVHDRDGHRAYNLLRKGQLSITLFHFEAGGELAKHNVNGVTSLQVLGGQLLVETDQSQQVLSEGDFFVLQSGVDHTICAFEESRALLTVERL
jgi:quercetin dioxygenase-like cupin family protein